MINISREDRELIGAPYEFNNDVDTIGSIYEDMSKEQRKNFMSVPELLKNHDKLEIGKVYMANTWSVEIKKNELVTIVIHGSPGENGLEFKDHNWFLNETDYQELTIKVASRETNYSVKSSLGKYNNLWLLDKVHLRNATWASLEKDIRDIYALPKVMIASQNTLDAMLDYDLSLNVFWVPNLSKERHLRGYIVSKESETKIEVVPYPRTLPALVMYND